VQDLIELQRHADKIDLTRAHLARARFVGDHLSRFRGRGMDYQESRAYQAGDDVRDMDWRLTARTGKPHVKLYREERERPVVLFLDLNAGMFFASRGMLKSVVAARACALIAWAAAARGDRIGAMLFDSTFCDLQPRGGRHGVLRLIRRVVEHTDPRIGVNVARQPGRLNAALGRLRRVSRPGSLVVLVSDYYGFDDDCGNHLLRLRQHSDVVAIRVVDPLEEAPPPAARYGAIADGLPGILDTRSAAVRKTYQHYFSRHHGAVAQIMRDRAIPLLRLSTTENVIGALRGYFAADGVQLRTSRRAA
jgi:uncharacterized protein (DUF58 family)